ncbi:unnamed protein product [Rotaria magnacalcarata]
MSAVQEEMFASYKRSPTDPKYHLALKYNLSEQQSLVFDIVKFRRALRTLTLSHDLLRSTFHIVGSELVYHEHISDLDSKLDTSVNWLTISNLTKQSEYILNIIRQSFDLEHNLPFRIHFIKDVISKNLTIVFVIHHIAADGYSLTKLIHAQLWELYDHDDIPNYLLVANRTFAQHVHERCAISQERTEQWTSDARWWQEHYGSAICTTIKLPPPEVPIYVSNSTSNNMNNEDKHIANRLQYKTLCIPADLWQATEALCSSNECTPFIACLSILWTLLTQYTQDDRFSIHIAFAARPGPYKNTVGPFAHAFPLSLGTNQSAINADQDIFNKFLMRTRRLILEAKQHEMITLSEIHLQTKQLQSMPAQVSIAISAISTPEAVPHLDSSECIFFSPSDFTIFLYAKQHTLEWCFNTTIIDSNLIDRLQANYLTLLQYVVRDSDRPMHMYNELWETEFNQVINRFQRTTTDKYYELTLHGIFEQAVTLWPNRVAIEHQCNSITYLKLNERATKLAIYLQRQSVKPNDLVCVLMEKSIAAIICILAVLKSGAGYVSVDVSLPINQIQHILKYSGSRLVLVNTADKGVWGDVVSTKQVRLEAIFFPNNEEEDIWINENMDSYQPIYNSKSMAYALWTSGVRSSSKWVEVNHGGTVNALLSLQDESPLKAEDKMLHVSSLSFDSSVAQLFHPFSQGACVVLIKINFSIDDVRDIIEVVQRHRVSVIELTPSLLNRVNPSDVVPPVRLVYISGETCPLNVAKIWSQKVPTYNLYGSTETSIYTHVARLLPDHMRVMIGRSLPNTLCYILDDQMRPVFIGVVGKLWIGGTAPARGYRNREDLTKSKFIDNTFHPHDGGMIFNTGDLARWQSDGQIEYLSHQDTQFKYHDNRIELDEIERCILDLKNSHNTQFSPQEAAVIVYNNDENAKESKQIYLCAYVTPTSVDLVKLKQRVNILLPSFMCPTYFITLDRLPLTNNGKINRNALSNLPIVDLTKSKNKPHKYQQTIQRKIHEIWCFLLKLDFVDPEESFFDIGGNSLLYLKLIGTIQKQFFAGRLSSLQPLIESWFDTTNIYAQTILIENSLKKNQIICRDRQICATKRRLRAHIKTLRSAHSPTMRIIKPTSRKSSTIFNFSPNNNLLDYPQVNIHLVFQQLFFK